MKAERSSNWNGSSVHVTVRSRRIRSFGVLLLSFFAIYIYYGNLISPELSLELGNKNVVVAGQEKEIRKPRRVLVVSELAYVKRWHWDVMLGNSWKRLQEYINEFRVPIIVQPDLFIACAEGACDYLKQKSQCINLTESKLTRLRHTPPLQCYFAYVPEDKNVRYRFQHSLNFLKQEPFISVLDLDVYDAFLRTDQDAVLLPGLLFSAPTSISDGWIGAGFYGTQATNHIISKFTVDYMPWLKKPIPIDFPSMQSTFYVHKSKIKPFIDVLLNATLTVYKYGFTKDYCNNVITSIPAVQKFQKKLNKPIECKWDLWHQGVASLYGTRIAVLYVLNSPKVTDALDDMHLSGKGPLHSHIQVHLLTAKHLISQTFNWRSDPSGFCDENKTLDKFKAVETIKMHENNKADNFGFIRMLKQYELVLNRKVRLNKDKRVYVTCLLVDYFRERCVANLRVKQ